MDIFKRKLHFFGDKKLVDQAQKLLVAYSNDDIASSSSSRQTNKRHPIVIGWHSTIPTFELGYSSERLRQGVSDHASSLVVILCDINTGNLDTVIPTHFIEEVCTFSEASVLWLTGIWQPDTSSKSGATPNLKQKQQELQLRNFTLKRSLKRGARYARWSNSENESLYEHIKELVENSNSKSNFVQNVNKPKSFSLTDAETGEEIKDPLELSEDDFIIAVMGPTGAEKSTFIKNATGYNPTIGDDLESCTSEIHVIRVQSGGSKIYIIVTPGHGNTTASDLEIFKLIYEWLRQRFTNRVYLAGLIYLYCTLEILIGGIIRSNLSNFELLCGEDCFHKITLVKTLRGNVKSTGLGNPREQALKGCYFPTVLARDADYQRLEHSKESARKLLDTIIDRARELRPLSLQKELVACQEDLPYTKAGRKMYSKLNEVLQSRQDALAQLNRDLRAEKLHQVRAIPNKERRELTQELTVLIADMQYMQLSLPARIAQLVTERMLLSPRSETAIENPHSKYKSASNMEMEKQETKFVSTTKWVTEIPRSLPELMKEDGVIGVVGPVGSGKTTFVNRATGSSLKVGHDLESCVSTISIVCFQHDNARIYVVDTPGFNDEDRIDADTRDLITKWFKECVPEINFAGIVYLHRITDDGVKRKWHENLKFFQELCSENYHKVTFATTMWDDHGQVAKSIGTHKEELALKEYFAHILSGGAQLKRLDNSSNSAKDLLRDIIRDFRGLQAVNVQKQVIAGHKDLAEVRISTDMDAMLIRVIGAHKETLVQLSREKRIEHSEHVHRILRNEYAKLAEELKGVIAKLKARSS